MGSVWASQSHMQPFVMRPRILISNSALRATGQADIYEIFPLLTLATASAGEINPLSADTGSRLQQQHTHSQYLWWLQNIAAATTTLFW